MPRLLVLLAAVSCLLLGQVPIDIASEFAVWRSYAWVCPNH